MAPKVTGLPTMPPQAAAKTMSSRLMTMRFMQRAAAASESSPPTTPTSGPEGPAKRRKTSHDSARPPGAATKASKASKASKAKAKAKDSPRSDGAGAAGTQHQQPLYDEKAVKAALEEEEKKREVAIAKRAAELGDARWVLDAPSLAPVAAASHSPLDVLQVGFAQIDSAPASSSDDGDDGGDSIHKGGSSVPSTTFRRFNMNRKPQANHPSSSSPSSSDESDTSDSGSESPTNRSSPAPRDRPGREDQRTGSEKRSRSGTVLSKKRSEERLKAQQLAGKRRKKEVKLNRLTSISSAGSSPFQRPSGATCYTCGKAGHKAPECPQKSSR